MRIDSSITNLFQYELISKYYTENQLSTTRGNNPYIGERELSRKIYSTIKNENLSNKLVNSLVQRTKDLKKIFDSVKFYPKESNIYLVEVSDPTKLEASLNNDTSEDVYYVKIQKLASNELVKSKELIPQEESIIPAGDYIFKIEVDGETYEINLSISNSKTYTNKDILRILSNEINNLNTNLVSEVKTIKKRSLNLSNPDSLIDYVYLQITNTEMGKDHYFVLKDINGTMIKDLRLNTIDISSSNSRYTLNSELKEANENSTSENSLNITLLDESNKYITLKISKINSELVDIIKNIIDQYNEYINWLNKNKYAFNQDLMGKFYKMISNNFIKLKEIDLHPNEKGEIIPGSYFNILLKVSPQKTISTLFGENNFFSDTYAILNSIIESPNDFKLSESKLDLYSKYGTIETKTQKQSINLIA
jgi:hypothetical protein